MEAFNMWLQVIVDFLDAIKLILKLLGLYNDPTTKNEE